MLSPEARRAVDRAAIGHNEKPGLDLIQPVGDLAVFPAPVPVEPAWFGAAPPEEPPAAKRTGHEPALGACVATHNPGSVNVNTAPMKLVDAALRQAGRGGIEQILQARTEGKQASVADEGRGRRGSSRLAILGTSTAWAFRIDGGVGPLTRSWWAVYEPGHDRKTTSSMGVLAAPCDHRVIQPAA